MVKFGVISVEKLLSEIDEILDSAWQLPMSGGKSVVDVKKIEKILVEIKENLPMEIVQAKKIVQDRSTILERARSEAENMIKSAEEKAKNILNNSEIMRVAQSKAESIVSEANAKAHEMRVSSNEYALSIMKNLDETVTNHLTQIRKTRHIFQTNNTNLE